MFIMLPCSQRALILVLEHMGNFFWHQIATCLQPPWRQCTLFVRSLSVKPLFCEVTSASKMYAANPD